MNQNERLASLEAKMEIFLKLLQEIRDDIKIQPSKESFDNLMRNFEELEKDTDRKISDFKNEYGERIENLNTTQKSLNFKVGSIVGAAIILSSLVTYFITYLTK